MKILFIAGHEFLEKQDNGGRQCSYRNYTMLQKCFGKANIYLCMLSNTVSSDTLHHINVYPTHHNKIEQIKNTLFMRNGYSRKTENSIIEYINSVDVDLIWFDFSITGALLNKLSTRKKVVVFMHNIEKNYMWNRVRHCGPSYLIPFFSYAYNEKNIVRKANAIICLNERDNLVLQKWYGRSADFIMPMTFKDQYDSSAIKQGGNREKSTDKKNLLFVGSLFAPNYDGILWFARNVMPGLNGFHLIIAGKDMEKRRNELESDNVEVIGTVDDLSRCYLQADAVVIPILYGDGMKIKTAEALMYGKPIFATKEALEGYEVAGVHGIWECNGVREFQDALQNYFSGPLAAESYCPAVRKLFLEKYENRMMEKNLKKFLEGIR